jgi:hypothetical protein
MNTRTTLFVLLLGIGAGDVLSQEPLPSPGARPNAAAGHGPPPQAYEDCRGHQAGDMIQHSTPEGMVPATCENSPEGLVARPIRQPTAPRGQGAPGGG